MDRFKITGLIMTLVGLFLGSSLVYYEYSTTKSAKNILQPQVAGIKEVLISNAIKSDNAEISSISDNISSFSSQTNSKNSISYSSNPTSNTLQPNRELLEKSVSKSCKEAILQSKNFVWEVDSNDVMNLGPNEQIIVLQCGYSQNSTYNVFHNSFLGLKLLEFDIFDYAQKMMIVTTDVAFTPSNNFPYPQSFIALINGKNGFDCGQMLYYSWQNTTKRYNLDKSKKKDCQSASLGYPQDSNWTNIYPKMD